MLKPQDLLFLLHLATKQGQPWDYRSVSRDLGLGLSEVSRCAHRAATSGLYNSESRKANGRALTEFIVHGVRYAFAASLGGPTRGVPTCHGGPFKMPFKNDGIEVPVWPYSEGLVRGVALEPLYKSVPQIVSKQKELYHLLVLVDFIRLGRQRERAWASDTVSGLLEKGGIYGTES